MERPNATETEDKPFDPETDKLYTSAQVAEMFGVSQETVRDWVNSKKITAIRLASKHLRFRRSDLATFASHRFTPEDN